MGQNDTYTAFLDGVTVAAGPLEQMLAGVKLRFDRDPGAPILIFEDHTGRQVDFDLRGSLRDVVARATPARERSGPGRPKLGVVAREISLLPRHWEWLEQQPNGASAAIRRLVDEARKQDPDAERQRLAIEAASRVMSALAGNLPGYEEATRALFGRNWERLQQLTAGWPDDIRDYVRRVLIR